MEKGILARLAAAAGGALLMTGIGPALVCAALMTALGLS